MYVLLLMMLSPWLISQPLRGTCDSFRRQTNAHDSRNEESQHQLLHMPSCEYYNNESQQHALYTWSTVVPGSTEIGLSSTNRSTSLGVELAAAAVLYDLRRPAGEEEG